MNFTRSSIPSKRAPTTGSSSVSRIIKRVVCGPFLLVQFHASRAATPGRLRIGKKVKKKKAEIHKNRNNNRIWGPPKSSLNRGVGKVLQVFCRPIKPTIKRATDKSAIRHEPLFTRDLAINLHVYTYIPVKISQKVGQPSRRGRGHFNILLRTQLLLDPSVLYHFFLSFAHSL